MVPVLVSMIHPTPGGGNSGASSPGNTNITTLTFPLLSLTNSWKYWQSGDPGTGWQATNFNDAPWPAGPALLYHEDSDLPGPKNTPLTLGKLAYYFRTRFQFPTNTAGVRLQLHPVVDDGAIFWLNGVESLALYEATPQ